MWSTAIAISMLPLVMLGLTLALFHFSLQQAYLLGIDVLGIWGLWWGDLFRLALILTAFGFSYLLGRQLIAPPRADHAWLPVLPLDQMVFHELLAWVAGSMRMPMPHVVAVDATGCIQAEGGLGPLSYLGLRVRIKVGLCLAVGLSARELAGLMAHEMAFHKPLSGARAGRIVRRIVDWFERRQRRDEWNDELWRSEAWGGFVARYPMWVIWAAAEVSAIPMRLLCAAAKALSAPALRAQVLFADQYAAAVAGSDAYATALRARARLHEAWQQLEQEILTGKTAKELPDNLPLLLARQLLTEHSPAPSDQRRTHWLPEAPTDGERLAAIRQTSRPGCWPADGARDATMSFSNFHELACRATIFYYQNELHKEISQIRLVTVEETIYGRRSAGELVEDPKRYFRGLTHPERACCGIVESNGHHVETEVLRIEPLDCREYLNKHSHQMRSLLKEWAKSWRMVRDLEAACTLKKAGLNVHRHQLAAFSVTELYEEIERQRVVMDSMESQLRVYEGVLETRMTCCLEMLAREPAERLPSSLQSVRRTLPHWVLIYEALGLNLPVYRELLTSFAAFQALGATVAGKMDSASYFTTVQAIMPKVIAQVRNIAHTLEQWKYPFLTPGKSERGSIIEFLAPRLGEVTSILMDVASQGSTEDRRVRTQEYARKLVTIVATFLDRYLHLYHQAFAWVTRAMQMAEWHFADPLEGADLARGVDEDRENREDEDELYDPSWLAKTMPIPDPEAEGDQLASLLVA